ncbi:sensor histidine kinase [Cohnella abietis]|uniref:histidine kinase n=1 Tax=Cohnella abietis TaxID=2507935 RepID=A0A3T1DF08_9BACL|nr:sensor histidine kinase [Cohnella abietis]BBI36717.1 histidine kinase [Cohnella abietis]
MLMKFLNDFLLPGSLKKRLVILLLICSLSPLIVIGGISYYSMHSILSNKAERAVRANLQQVRLTFENTFSQLNHASQLLAFDGRVGQSLDVYLQSEQFERRERQEEIQSQVNLIHFTNPSLGLMFYYSADTLEHFFENYSVSNFNPEALPLLSQFTGINYYGPHKSFNSLNGDNVVLSVIRKVNLPSKGNIYVYIETNYKFAESIIKNDLSVQYLIADRTGTIVYSENQKDFPLHTKYFQNDKKTESQKKYLTFEDVSNQQWKVISTIDNKVYTQEISSWVKQFMIFAICSLLLSFLIAWILWRSIYKPLQILSKSIEFIKNNKLIYSVPATQIVEFDLIGDELEMMRKRIGELINEVRDKEKKKALLEIEKLTHQINPHFLYNTLDTIRWLARANGQAEIDTLVSTLNKVLHYNLGKGGPAVIRQEIEALHNYVKLQGIRYNFDFDVKIFVSDDILELPIPRFLLQPLVENSLYHGLEDNGSIQVRVERDGERHVNLFVSDNGQGMSDKQIRRLTGTDNGDQDNMGLGIGLNYVYRMLKFKYGEEADLTIESNDGKGTLIKLRIPIMEQLPNSLMEYGGDTDD